MSAKYTHTSLFGNSYALCKYIYCRRNFLALNNPGKLSRIIIKNQIPLFSFICSGESCNFYFYNCYYLSARPQRIFSFSFRAECTCTQEITLMFYSVCLNHALLFLGIPRGIVTCLFIFSSVFLQLKTGVAVFYLCTVQYKIFNGKG